jgi:hypothetical protein
MASMNFEYTSYIGFAPIFYFRYKNTLTKVVSSSILLNPPFLKDLALIEAIPNS